MTRVFIDRPPTEKESERLRLLLSTYQDGTGMMQPQGRRQFTLPGWRDFERACAIAFGGHAPESKFYLDVLFPYREEPNVYYGIDCKMRGELGLLARKGRLYVEVVNASKSLWSHLATRGITEANYRDEPACAGASLLEAIDLIKQQPYAQGKVVNAVSCYLLLLWDRTGTYQLFQLPLHLPEPAELTWTCHVSTRRDGTETTRLVGEDDAGVLYEWYGDSGGQFKYYPLFTDVMWTSAPFQLEPLSDAVVLGIEAKASAYFPALWQKANE